MAKKNFKIKFSYGDETITLEWKNFEYSLDSLMDFMERFLPMTGFNQEQIELYISQWAETIANKREMGNGLDDEVETIEWPPSHGEE